MASIKVRFRPSIVTDHEGTIYYQIVHDRKSRQLLTDYHILPSEWDDNRSMVVTSYKSDRKEFILSVRKNICCDIERLSKIIHKLDTNGLTYTAVDLIDEFNSYMREYSLFNYMESTIIKLKQNGKIRTSETYRVTLNNFKKYRNDKDIMLDRITSDIMEGYESWLKERGIIPNTSSFYMRILRAVYNRAVETGRLENQHPFRKVYTGVSKTMKRALPLLMIRVIKDLDLSKNPKVDYARDMFLLSFYLRGMSFIDMAFLKKSDLKNKRITYRRCKTGHLLTIGWTKEMQLILDKYPENKSDYLLPIICNPCTNERNTYRNTNYTINRGLKKIAMEIGINIPLTLYVARHSWASAAKSKGIPISIISESLGHDRETTTQIYLASLDTSIVDCANSIILKSLQ